LENETWCGFRTRPSGGGGGGGWGGGGKSGREHDLFERVFGKRVPDKKEGSIFQTIFFQEENMPGGGKENLDKTILLRFNVKGGVKRAQVGGTEKK